jgi:predicted nucleic acid-binding protein
MKIFLDTNVVLDLLARRDPFHQEAETIFSMIEERAFEAFVSAVSFTTIYYVLRRAFDRQHARSALRVIAELLSVVRCDASIITQAIDSEMRDFEDAVQYLSARAVEADVIITRNSRDFPADAPSKPLTPREFLAAYASGEPQ